MPRYTIIARFKGEEAPNAREAAKQIIRYVDENGIDEKNLAKPKLWMRIRSN